MIVGDKTFAILCDGKKIFNCTSRNMDLHLGTKRPAK